MSTVGILGALAGGYLDEAEKDKRRQLDAGMQRWQSTLGFLAKLAGETDDPEWAQRLAQAGLELSQLEPRDIVSGKWEKKYSLASMAPPPRVRQPTVGPTALAETEGSLLQQGLPVPPSIQEGMPVSGARTRDMSQALTEPVPLFYSPEEKARLAGRAKGVMTGEALKAAQQAAREIYPDFDELDPYTQASIVHGMGTGMSLPAPPSMRGTLVREDRYARSSDPSKPYPLLRNSKTGELTDPQTGAEVVLSQLVPFERAGAPRAGWIIDKESSSGFAQVFIDPRTSQVIGEPVRGLLPPAHLMEQITTGFVTAEVDDPDTGLRKVVRVPSTTTKAPVLPGGGGRATGVSTGVPARVSARVGELSQAAKDDPSAEAKRLNLPKGSLVIGQKSPQELTSIREFAVAGLDHIPEARQLISELGRRKQLGPLMGRWSEFITSDVGADDAFPGIDPETAGLYIELRNNLTLVSSLLARVHGGARGGGSIQMVQRFDKMMSSAKMTPNLLNSALNVTESWLERYTRLGLPRQGQGQGLTAPPGEDDAVQRWVDKQRKRAKP